MQAIVLEAERLLDRLNLPVLHDIYQQILKY